MGIFASIRSESPMVHALSNHVTSNDCANLLLASGARPIMADDPAEVEEITRVSQALVINMGTPDERKISAALKAGKTANQFGIPVVLDPVGVGSSLYRTQAVRTILEQVQCSVIRGNAEEIRCLAQDKRSILGVDAGQMEISPDVTVDLARKLRCTIIVSATQDILTDGKEIYRVMNGHPMMRSVTGSGCQASCLIAAFLTQKMDSVLQRSLWAVCAYGLAGEIAYQQLLPQEGNASYRNRIIDSIYHMNDDTLLQGAKYEKL